MEYCLEHRAYIKDIVLVRDQCVYIKDRVLVHNQCIKKGLSIGKGSIEYIKDRVLVKDQLNT